MRHEEFMQWCDQRMERGSRDLAATMRHLLARNSPELSARMAGASATAVLEPLLFAYFRRERPEVTLGQLLVGSLLPAARPERIEVRTDQAGRVYLPAIGYFLTELRNQAVVLSWRRSDGHYRLERDDGSIVASRFEPLLMVPDTPVEVLRYEHPLLAPFLWDTDRQLVDVVLDDAPTVHLAHLAGAFRIIREVDRRLYDQLTQATRRLVLHRHPGVHSRATIAAHGTAFFSTRPEHDEPFFIDDLIHQCNHVVFNAITARRADYLTGDPDQTMTALTGKARDIRTVYGAFHGLYTEYHMTHVQRLCDERRIFQGRAAHELLGRFAFIGRKYLMDAHSLDRDCYTTTGRECFEVLRADALALRDGRPDLWELDMSGQGYVFDYPIFAQKNLPAPEPSSVEKAS